MELRDSLTLAIGFTIGWTAGLIFCLVFSKSLGII